MSHVLAPGRRRTSIAIASIAALALAGLAGTTSYAAGSGVPSATARSGATPHDARGYYDVRTSGPQAQADALRAAHQVTKQPAARAALAAAPRGVVTDIDGTTSTVRMQTRLDGFLTGASKKSPFSIAMGYVRSHRAELGLSRADLTTFHLHRNYRDITGAHHLYFTQRIGGKQVLGNGLTATVNKAGHLLTVGGSPMKRQTPQAKVGPSPDLATPDAALDAARDATGGTTDGSDLSADGVTSGLFVTGTGALPAWQAIVMSAKTPTMVVLDARTGDLLQSRPLVNYDATDSTGNVYPFFPGSRKGGKQVRVNFTKRHWLSGSARVLNGNNSHTYSDVNDNNHASTSEEVPARTPHSWGYPLKPFHLGFAKSFCSNPWPCSWNPNKPFSWRTNRAQNATQVFYFVNNWHDHLQKAPIGFTEAAGNFQKVNRGKAGKGSDPVNTQTDDGANTDGGLPDGGHIDNANMGTPPDGRSPQMQMFLQHQPGTSYPAGDPFSPTNVGDEADTVYHEYTHGLSNRLNVDVQGRSTLGGVQAGAMGEAWSDWYAMDYLVDHGLQRDRAAKADVRLFIYDGEGVNFDRTEPIDCKVGQKVRLCNGGATGHRGGYTYRDYSKVIGIPEVHSDGEIWAQTLWSLRHAIGAKRTEALVTRAMEIAPYNPSFLDMRNAILVADTSVLHGQMRNQIWKVFASRGMGFFAGSLGGNDSTPGWSFDTPPKKLRFATITGTVTDADSDAPVAGLPVTLAFQGAGRVNPTDVTDASGHYTITAPVGSYKKLQVVGQGYSDQEDVNVAPAGTTVDFDVHRDLATRAAGASIATQTGVVFAGCSPRQAVDQNLATGWSTNINTGSSQDPTNHFVPKSFVVHLDRAYDIKSFGVDPSASCGDGASASTGAYQIETSPTGLDGSWTTVKDDTFTSANNGRINPVTPNSNQTGVNFVRFTVKGNQTPSFSTSCPGGAFSGCQFVDLTELEIFGAPTL
jgi:extracellular elastinolytic metalloproteinase